jgi:pimeloyl-ACP methyl ester carboxylesterase
MLTTLQGIYNLQWKPNPKFRPLPPHISREFVTTPNGGLELLVSEPRQADKSCPPIIFAHGGFGHASLWLEWMAYFHHHYGGTTYAYSARNHGASYGVTYLKMVWGTSLDDVASDWASVIHEVKHRFEHGSEPVLVGHSAGGALTQYVLVNRMATTRGLCLLGSVPHFGGYGSYWNWLKADPWLLLRNLCSGGHPTSPLSQPSLVDRAFFGPHYPKAKEDGWAKVKEFMQWMPGYESMAWAMALNGSFWKWICGRNEWLDVSQVLASINHWEQPGDRICIMVGSHDRLTDPSMAERSFKEYADAVATLQRDKKLDILERETASDEKPIEGIQKTAANRVRLLVVQGAGHHTQNDIQCNVAAEACLRWIEQL